MRAVVALLLLLVGMSTALADTHDLGAGDVLAMGNATLSVVPYGIKCPFSIDNGCAESITGQPGSAAVLLTNARLSPANGNMVNALTASTTDYSNQPGTRFSTENFAAVDYWVGSYTNLSSMKDPLDPVVGVVMTTPPGECVYQPTSNAGGGPRFECNNLNTSTPVDISVFDFTRGGTTCIALDVEGSSTSTLTVRDNYWKNNGSCALNTVDPYMLKGGLTNGTNEFAYNTLDMNASVFPYEYGSCAVTIACNPSEAYVTFGDMNMHHNAFLNFSGRPLQYVMANPSAGMNFTHNYVQGEGSSSPAAHGEFWLTGSTGTGLVEATGQFINGNTILATTAHNDSGDEAFGPQFNTANPTPIFDMEDNFYVAGTAGGSTVGVRVSGTVHGSVFTTSAITGGKFGSGQRLQCTTAAGNFVNFMPVALGSTGTTSLVGGGANSGSNQVTTWPMMFTGPGGGNGSTFGGGLDDGSTPHATFTGTVAPSSSNLTVTGVTNTIVTGQSLFGPTGALLGTITGGSGTAWTVSFTAGTGGLGPEAMTSVTPGNVLTVTDPVLNMAVGVGIFSNTIGTRAITAQLSGTGGAGTYTVSGSAGAALVANAIAAAPASIYPGQWSISGSPTCTNSATTSIPFSVSWIRDVQLVGQVISKNNTFDLFAYSAGINAVNTQASFARNFNGTISGNTLSVNSGTDPGIGTGLSTNSPGIIPGTFIQSGTFPTYTLNTTYTTPVLSEAMTALQVSCGVPAVFSGNTDLTGVYSGSVNAWAATVSGSGC